VSLVVAYIDAHRDRFGVEPICRVLRSEGIGIAVSTYYAARSRPPSPRAIRDAYLEAEITRVWKASTERSGARKVWHQLRRDGVVVGRCTVERLMARLGLRGVRRGGYRVRTTVADASLARPADLVDRDFAAAAPDRLWVVDYTYIATWAGTVYTALVVDAFSRLIVGWKTATSHDVTLVLDALVMAVAARARSGRSPSGAIHHSDAGAEYCSIRYGRELAAAGLLPSVGSVGDSYDNALAETMIGLYKTEVIDHLGPWRDVRQVETATAEWVGWFNHTRLFGPIGYLPPAEYEAAYHAGELDHEDHTHDHE
jgi:putative transposase